MKSLLFKIVITSWVIGYMKVQSQVIAAVFVSENPNSVFYVQDPSPYPPPTPAPSPEYYEDKYSQNGQSKIGDAYYVASSAKQSYDNYNYGYDQAKSNQVSIDSNQQKYSYDDNKIYNSEYYTTQTQNPCQDYDNIKAVSVWNDKYTDCQNQNKQYDYNKQDVQYYYNNDANGNINTNQKNYEKYNNNDNNGNGNQYDKNFNNNYYNGQQDGYQYKEDNQYQQYQQDYSYSVPGPNFPPPSPPIPNPSPPSPLPIPSPPAIFDQGQEYQQQQYSQQIVSTSVEQEYLDIHNNYRNNHCVNSLRWDSVLENSAREFAQGCRWGHDVPLLQGLNQGENLYAAGPAEYFRRLPQEVMSAWYDEIDLFDYFNPKFEAATGHFTQIVWEDTSAVGCAIHICPEYVGSERRSPLDGSGSWEYVVCRYDPPGNVLNYMAVKVTPPCSN